MHRLNLAQANALIEAAIAKGAELGLKPLTVTVHDAGGHMIACQRQDGASNMRVKLAAGKASGALALMHGPTFRGDCAGALHRLADYFENALCRAA